ncbi:MAG: SDR family oxidoreductase [Xanthobacteraceae bacterium]
MLEGKAAIVTGSVQGLGYALADKLAASGCNIMLTGLTDAAAAQSQRGALEQKHSVRVTYHNADLAEPMQIDSLVDETVKQHGSVDILVNNAVYRHRSPVENFPDGEWDRALAVNVSAPFHLIKRSLPHMRRAKWGRIINIGSIRSFLAVANRIDYVTAKHAMIGMTRAVAQEVLKDDITCNAICPGSLRTPHSDGGIRKIMETKHIPEQQAEAEYLGSREPRGRFNALENVAGVLLFLCGPLSRDINGTAIPVDGGRHGAEFSSA